MNTLNLSTIRLDIRATSLIQRKTFCLESEFLLPLRRQLAQGSIVSTGNVIGARSGLCQTGACGTSCLQAIRGSVSTGVTVDMFDVVDGSVGRFVETMA